MNRPVFLLPLEMFQECVDNCMKICTCGGQVDANPVVVIRRDGQVMEYPRRIRCSEVLAANPHYRICHASALLLKQKSQILSTTAWLQPGEVYFLLPKPGTPASARSSQGPESSLQFRIPKDYLDKVLGSAAKPGVRKRIKKPPPKVLVTKRSRSNMVSTIDSSMQFVVPKDMLAKDGEEAAAAKFAGAAKLLPAPRPILQRSPSIGKGRPQIRLRRNRASSWQPPLDTITEGSARSSHSSRAASSRSSGTSRSFGEHAVTSSPDSRAPAATSIASKETLSISQLHLQEGDESEEAEDGSGGNSG